MSSVPRVLVADDDLTACLLMEAALEKACLGVAIAHDGHDALQQFALSHFDMVMLDVDMPGLDGYAVCTALRRRAGAELPIMMVTGMDDEASIERAYEAGATDFIAKPINWSLIGHRARYLLRSSRSAAALLAANARNAAMLDAIPDTLLRIGADGRILEVRASDPERAQHCATYVGQPLSTACPTVAPQIEEALREAHRSRRPQSLEFVLPGEGRADRHQEARVVAIDDAEALCLVRDITDRKDYENRIYRLAYIDTLTGLASRQAFLERLQREIGRAALGKDERIAVLFLDLDGFKGVNDAYGHAEGDLLLQTAAGRLMNAVRPSDVVARTEAGESRAEFARLGGDEFAVLLPRVASAADALQVAERIRTAMQQPFVLRARVVNLTASIGIAIFPEDGHDAATLLKHADTAMYHAKDQGRNACRYYSADLTAEAMRKVSLATSLRHALEQQEFSLAYQPQIDAESGRMHAVEALLRWHHPTQGAIAPLDFIPFAEENGMIVPIGWWVLRQACVDAAAWRAAGTPLRVAVNLSPLQFRTPELIDTLQRILTETGVPPDCLELEITESALLDDGEATLTKLLGLRDLGIRIALDDFGTGYSSLSYLKRLPLHTLKIDKGFVHGLPADRDNLAIVRAIVALAQHLGFSLVAEGVETAAQAGVLRELGCGTLQGYHFSHALPAAAIAAHTARSWEVRTPCAADMVPAATGFE